MFVPAYEGQFPSLGPQVIKHVQRHLGIKLMREQAERLVHLYRLDLKGRRVVRRAGLRRPKGSGKSPEGAYCGFAEFSGPVVFAGWDENGQPKGRRHTNPWVQFAACSEDQTSNVSVWLFDILNDRPDTLAELNIDLGRTRIYFKGEPGRIETVTAAAGSREGQPITFAVLDQTEEWKKSNGGLRLARTLQRNVSKNDQWSYELQNAPGLDDGSVAAQTQKDWERGFAGIFFDTREPSTLPNLDDIRSRCEGGVPTPDDRALMLKGLAEVYGESADRGYVNIERLADESVDPSTTISDQLRYYFNLPVADEDHWCDARSWDARSVKVAPEPLEEITAGFVGRAYQGAALIACRIATGELWTVKTWETAGDELVSRSEVHAAVGSLFDSFTVRRFYANPQEWASEYDTWRLAWGEDVVVSRPPQQTANQAYAVDRFRTAIGAGQLHHDGNEALRRHILGAQTKTVAAGTLIIARTEAPADQITAAKAAVLAWEARADVLTVPDEEEESCELISF